MKIPIHKIQKINVNKSDEVALVVEKMIDSDAREVVLNIPRFSKLADSLANFHLIKREAGLLRKKVIIESVDDKVIELSGVAGIDSWNPILSRSRRQFADIVSARQTREEVDEGEIRKKKLVESFAAKTTLTGKAGHSKRKANPKRFFWIGGVAIVVAGFFLFANTVLPHGDIKLTTLKSDWIYNDSVLATKLALVDAKAGTIPAQIFTAKQTFQLSYPASGKKSVQQKAGGPLTIYNAYSSDPQKLVATTRFIAPDGKIFRLVKEVIVPGAKVVEGQIIPSTLDAEVIADQPGADYNIGPVSHFTIPGFKGTPKYQAFYAESKTAMTGGYIGAVAYPTDADLKKAKADLAVKIEKAARDKIASQIPPDFKIIDGASSFALLKQNVITAPDSGETFAVADDAQVSEIAFKESDLIRMLTQKIQKDKGPDYEVKSYTLGYGSPRSDFAAGKLSFPVNFKAVVAQRIDVDELRRQVKGKSESELKTVIYALPELKSAAFSLWPFWVKSVPQNEAKISIAVD